MAVLLTSRRFISSVLCLFFCLVVLAGASIDLLSNYKSEREHTEVQLKNQSVLIAEWIAGAFLASDNVLRDITSAVDVNELHYPPLYPQAYQRRADWLAHKRDTVPYAFLVGLFDKNCKLVLSPQPDGPLDFNASEREYCQLLKQEPGRESVVTPLFMTNFKRYSVTQARRVGPANEAFSGFATLGLDPDLFSQVLRKIEIGPSDSVTIIDSNFKIVARNPMTADIRGRQTGDEQLNTSLTNFTHFFVRHQVSSVDNTRRLFAFQKVEGLPFFVVMGRSDKDWLASWFFRLYLVTFVSVALIMAAVLIARYQWRQYAFQADLTRAATTDPLTGSLNRRSWMERAQLLLTHAQRNGRGCALLMIDIDYFKRINDEHGHAIGDFAIQTFAQACQSALREVDLLCRFGGDEFVALLDSNDATESAATVAERVRKAVAEATIQDKQGRAVPLTASIGVLLITPNFASIDMALAQADQLLYQAKELGRNRIQVGSM